MAIPDIVEPDDLSAMEHRNGLNEQGPSLKEGYMFVLKSSIWKPWASKAKYLILTSDCLYCFKRRGDLTSIPCDVMFLKDASVTIDDVRKGMRKRFYIKLTSPSHSAALNLYCFMEEERNEWFTAIMQVLSNLYVKRANFVKKSSVRSAIFKACSFEDGFFKNTLLRPLGQTKAYSTSCMELTNMSVLPGPENPSLSPTPIKQSLAVCEITSKRSSSSADIPWSVTGLDQNISSPCRTEPSKIVNRPKSFVVVSDFISPSEIGIAPVMSHQRAKEHKARALSMTMLNVNIKGHRDCLSVN